jgi:hypothetical protein
MHSNSLPTYRVHVLGAALAVRAVAAQVVKEANETQIRKLEEFFHRITTSTPNCFVIDYKPELSGQIHVLDFVVVILLTFIGSYIIYQFIISKRRRNSFQIIMDVFGTHGRTTMTVMHLPHHSSMYHYKSDSQQGESYFLIYLSYGHRSLLNIKSWHKNLQCHSSF